MKIFSLIIALVTFHLAHAQFQDSAPPQQWVIDPDSFLTQEQNEETTARIKEVYSKDSSGIFLLIVKEISSDIGSYTKKYFQQWNLNQAGMGRTVLFVYVYGQHGLRIEASDDALLILGKQYLRDILTYTVNPRMRKRQDYLGIYKGLDLIGKKFIAN